MLKHSVDAAEDDVAPEEGEDDGAGEQEVEESDLDLPKQEGETEAKGSRRSENICYIIGFNIRLPRIYYFGLRLIKVVREEEVLIILSENIHILYDCNKPICYSVQLNV